MPPALESTVYLFLLLLVNPSVQETSEEFLNIHNKYRGLARNGLVPNQPKATYMPDLVYDKKLEVEARKWAVKCNFMHEPDQETGENLAISTNKDDEMISHWYAEYQYFTFGKITADSSPKYLHYTQLVWADTEKVGCVKQHCPKLKLDDGTTEDAYYTVCRYSPGGNFADEEPYPID